MSVTLCVDGLPLGFSSVDLRKLAEPHGPVVTCRVGTEQSGRSLRFGYVEVATSANAEAVIKGLTGAALNGKPVSVAVTKNRLASSLCVTIPQQRSGMLSSDVKFQAKSGRGPVPNGSHRHRDATLSIPEKRQDR
jgi:RNA recognition motif-containing protein